MEKGLSPLNKMLKSFGFSTMYWETQFNIPTSVGYYMDKESCRDEQKFLKKFLHETPLDNNLQMKVQMLFTSRYLRSSESMPVVQLRFNYPDALSNMIDLAMTSHKSEDDFRIEIKHLQNIFEKKDSCLEGI